MHVHFFSVLLVSFWSKNVRIGSAGLYCVHKGLGLVETKMVFTLSHY